MVTFKLNQLIKQGLLALAIVVTAGGVQSTSNLVSTAEAVAPQPQTTSTSDIAETTAFSVCSEATNWQRPNLDQQQKQLSTDERYSALLQDKDFQQLANQFWQHDVLSFTTYGLSARMEPINLSGLWAVADDVWANCYSNNEGSAINEGNLAEAWVINHRVVDVQWQNDHYVMVVEPSSAGMQVVQFARLESESELPLTVVTGQGTNIEHHDADW